MAVSPGGCLVKRRQDRISEKDQGWEEETKHGVRMEDTGSRNNKKTGSVGAKGTPEGRGWTKRAGKSYSAWGRQHRQTTTL